MITNRDFADLFAAFNGEGVRYLVVGAYAVAFHHRPRFTKDIDIWVEPSEANAAAVVRALRKFGAPLLGATESDFPRPGCVFQIGVSLTRIDILTSLPAVEFESSWRARSKGTYGDIPVAFLGKADLIRNKRAVGRPQDLRDVRALESSAPPRRRPRKDPRRRR